MIVTLSVTIPTFPTDVNAMPAKTGSSWVIWMSSIFVTAMILKNLVWKKPLKPTLTAREVENPQMTTSLENEIIGKLCQYIDGVITIKEFSDWFVPATWNATKDDYRANQLIYSIKMCFTAYSKEELRERLIDLIL